MAGPWEKYQAAPAAPAPAAAGPWTKYSAPAAPAMPAADPSAQPGQFDDLIKQTAAKYQLDPRVFRAQIQAESAFNPKAVSPAGARGLGQLMPATAQELGVTDPFDPVQNLEGSAKYMRQLLDRYKGNTNAALAAYNWGMGNLDKKGLKNMPEETRNYIAKIRANSGDPDVPMPGVAPERFTETVAPDVEASLVDLEKRRFEERMSEIDYLNEKSALLEEQFERTGQRPKGAAWEDVAGGFGRGLLQDPISAVRQLTDLRALVPDTLERRMGPMLGRGERTQSEYEAELEKARERYRMASGEDGIDLGRMAGNILNPASLATGAAGALPGAVARLAPKIQQPVMAAIRGAAGAATVPVNPEDAGGVLGQKAVQVGVGGAAGPVAEGITRGLTAIGGRTAGAIADKMASEEVEALVDLSRRWGIDLLAGDYDNNRRILRGVEGRLINSQIPGLNIDLRIQQQQAQKAAEKLVSLQNKQLQSMTYASLPRIQEIAAGAGKRAPEAQAILKMVEEAGTDARKVIQASGNMKWLRMKLSSDELYDQVERLAGQADVPPVNTVSALDRALAQGEQVVDVDRGALNLIQQWRDRLDVEDAASPNTYMRMREFLTDVRNRVDQATTAGTTKSGALWLKDVAKGIQADMDAFATANPALRAANERANKFYTDRVLPFQQTTLAKALKSDDPDEIWRSFVRSGADWRGDHAQQVLYKALDPKGQAAVRAGMIEDAFRQATDPEHFTPTGFNKIIRQTGYDSFFRGPARTELDGLMHIMDRINRSDPQKLATFTPMLGNLASMGGIGLASGAVGPSAIASALAATGAMKWLVTTDAGRRILYSANLMKPGVAETGTRAAKWAQLLENINRQVPGVAGKAAGQESGQ